MGSIQRTPEKGTPRNKARPLFDGGSAARGRAAKAAAILILATSLFAAEPSLQSRVIQVEKRDIIPIYATYNFSTMIVLPEKEEIADVEAGEKDFWAIDNTERTVSVKPLLLVKLAHKKIDPTNINIIAASGNVYSVVVSEVSGTDQPADLKIILEQKDPRALTNIEHPQFVRADYAEQRIAQLKQDLDQTRQEAAHVQSTASVSEIEQIRHDYEWKDGKAAEAIGLKSIWHDRVKTYIEARSQDAAVPYEIKDGKPVVTQYTLHDGIYTIDHIVDEGVLKAGKKGLKFERVKESS